MKTKLREIREVKKLTLKEFAEILKCSPSYLCEIELGTKFPSGKKLAEFSEILKIPASKLIRD